MKNEVIIFLIVMVLSGGLMSCSCAVDDEERTSSTRRSRGAIAYTTWFDQSGLMVKTSASKTNGAVSSPVSIRLTQERFQSIVGFGAALTHASCYNLMKMKKSDRSAFLKEFFSVEEGMGVSMVRISIGGSDFSLKYFTWEDIQGMRGPHENDLEYVIPILKEIRTINPNLKILASPWTAPAWMKKETKGNNGYQGGHLKPSSFQDYADYLVYWIKYFQSQGLNIEAITLQNESLTEYNKISMIMFYSEAVAFLKKLGPAFKNAGIDTKILVFDHNYNYDNWDNQRQYPLKVYQDEEASQYVTGSAWHSYGGSETELDVIHAAAPDKEIWFTECSIGTWFPEFEAQLNNDFKHQFIGTLKRWGRSVLVWNLMLDTKNGPNLDNDTCFGVVTLGDDNKTLVRNSQYYALAHCARVIRSGAVRVGTEGFSAPGIDYLAFLNPDGTWGVIIQNENQESQQLLFISDSHSVKTTVPGRSLVSLTWSDD